jgi:hypothetical protein
MKRVRKALLAGVGAALTGLITAAEQSGKMPGVPELGAAVALGIVAAWAVWRVPNAPTPPDGVAGRYVAK